MLPHTSVSTAARNNKLPLSFTGRARSTLGGDPGSMERESALLAMLVQMDGIHGKLEQVRGWLKQVFW